MRRPLLILRVALVALVTACGDPDELFWLVAVSGPDLPQGRGGPYRPNASPPPPTAWILFETAATAGGRSASTGAQYSVAGTWPAGFDALPDRCR